MRILFIVPTRKHKFTAGSRIRYDRLRQRSDYFDVLVQSMDDLTNDDIVSCSVCVFSKTYSISAICIAENLRKRGIIIGVDLFDDYFSHHNDPRLTIYRTWLQRFGPLFHFALCSTTTMQRVVNDLVPGLPIQILPDPYPEFDAQIILDSLNQSLDRTYDTGIIQTIWFGIGSNPFFSVGIRDLCSYSWSLAELASGRYGVNLKIITDTASLNSANLARISQLPVPYTIEAWTPESEMQGLKQALVAFIPVNGQSFSRAKSPNRALTAITGGAQVLSPGFPLYQELCSAVYTNATCLLSDIERRECKINASTIYPIISLVSDLSGLDSVVTSLFLFLTRQIRSQSHILSSADTGQAKVQAILYAIDPERSMYSANEAAKVFSIRSPYARNERVFDVRLDYEGGRLLTIWVRSTLVPYLSKSFRDGLSDPKKIGKVHMMKVAPHQTLMLDAPLPVLPSEPHPIMYETGAYYSGLSDIMRVCQRAFPTLGIHVAGLSSYTAFEEALSSRAY